MHDAPNSLRKIDETTLLEAIRLGIHSGADRIHFRPGCLPLFTWHGGARELHYRQLTAEDTEEIAGLMLARAFVPERVARDRTDVAHALAFLCELPGEALLSVDLARERGQLAVAVSIVRPVTGIREAELG